MKNLYPNSIVKNLKHIASLLVILFGFSNAADAQVRKVFTQRTSQYSPTKKIYNVKGDFTMLGNTCLTPQFYTATTNNNDATMVYVDSDNDASTFNSSSSTLVFNSENGSVPSCSNIVYAGLYWTGRSAQTNTFVAGKSYSSSQSINFDGNIGHGLAIPSTSYTLNLTRGGSSSTTRYPIYTFSSGSTTYAFRFYNSGATNRVTVSVNGGSEANLPSSVNGAGTEATFNTPYTITNGTITLTLKKLIRDASTGSSLADIQTYSSVDYNTTGTSNVVGKTFNKRVVKLKGPTSGAYTEITAGANDIYYPTTNSTNTDDYIYSAYAEITDYVRANGAGQYTVADMALLEGNPGGTGYSGGWGIVVVYENSKMKWRDVTIFDGYAYVESGNSSAGLQLPVSGFNSAISGNVGMKIGVMASEGDIGYTSDYFKIQNRTSTNYTTLSRTADGAIPNPDNFFRSYINAPGARVPNLDNNTGIDIGIINIPNTNNAIINNSQTSTTFLYGTNGDTYSIFTIAMSVDAYVPESEGIITATTINNQPAVQPYTVTPGQEAGFSIDVRNLGTEAINNYRVVIPVPYNASYVAGSASGTIYYTTPNTTITGTFDPTLGATGSIVWNFGTLPLPASPTTLLARLTFKLKATTDCDILANATCSSTIAVNGNSVGVGATTNVALNNSTLIQGYAQNGTCTGSAIPTPINVGINGTAYVQANCPGTDFTRHFSYCSASTTVLPSQIASNFPTGSTFYNSFPVTLNSVQYTESNPIPLVAGSTITYYAIPPGGGSGCNFPFTVAKCPVIVAQDDTIAGGNGTAGNTNAGNVLNNNGHGADTLNGTPATIAQTIITVTTPATSIGGNPVPVIDVATGQISVPPGTPAGTYTIVYNLCERQNPTSNCDPATVTITVTAPSIVAQNDTINGGNGVTGNPNAGNILNNNGNGPDTLNGNPATISQVNISITNPATPINGNPVPAISTTTGQISVPPGTPAGTYTITYNLCEKLNPTNCDPATVTITVTAPPIIAQDDTLAGGNGTTGNPNAGNVLNNNGNGPDTLNGNPVTISQVTITVTTPATPIAGAPVPTLATASGVVFVPGGTPAGTYTIVYNLCERLNPSNCDPATVTITVTAPPIIAQDDTFSGGNSSTGNPNAGNVLNDNGNGYDMLNGGIAPITLVNISVTTPAVSIGGAPVPTLSTVTGNVSVPAGTAAGTYTIVYNLCEKLNPTNCDPATVTITVTAPAIIAQDDTLSGGNGANGNPNAGNVLNNNGHGADTLNGNPVTISQVTITVSTPAVSIGGAPVPTLATATGQVSVPPGTPAGTYTIVYNLCERLNPTNCDPATVTITVTAPAIIANDDAGTPVNGLTGGVGYTNVLVNDTLNGQPVLASQVNTTFVSSSNAGITLSGTNVIVAPGTPAGSYTLTYQICEILNPTNCDTAIVTVAVQAPQIIANDDTGAPVNGLTGGVGYTNVLVNDTLNGQPVLASQVNTTFVSSSNAGITLSGTNVIVAPGTPAGSYTLTYQICEILNPTNCDTAIVTVAVQAPQIIANDDTGAPINGLTGGVAYTNVLVNDTLNGVPVLASQVNTTFVSSTNPGITLVGNDVIVAPGTPAGSYTLTYQICEILNPTNCDTAIVTVAVQAPQIIANDDAGAPVNGLTGGVGYTNVLVNDTLNGVPVLASQVNTTFVSSTNPGITLSGTNVIVAPGTPAGSYTLTYQICEILNPTNCDTAIVTVAVQAPQIIANDDAGAPVNGLTGGVGYTNVLVNDTLNGVPVLASQVNTTFVSSTNPGITLSGTNVIVAPGTPAGSYTLTYQICEILNPTNCDTAIVTVAVQAPQIIANDDAGAPVNGLTGGVAYTNVLVNDTLNGVPVLASQVNTTFVSSTNPGITLSGTNVIVAPGTPAGSYTLTYQICEILNPTNCDTAIVTVAVQAPQIIANDDTGAPVNGLTGGVGYTNVLVNDTLNGVPVLASQVNTTFVSSTNPGITLVGNDVIVAPGTPAGSYTLTYQICEILNPTNCDTAIVTVTVTAAAIEAIDDNYTSVQCSSVGVVGNILSNDSLNGSVGLSTNLVNLTILSGSYPNLNIDNTGNINLTSIGSCGSYTFTYRICEILNPNNCDDATVTVTVQDLIAPTFTAPANIEIFTTADCTYDASVTATGDVTNEADNCSTGLQATFTDSVANGACAGSHVITRTWSLVDNCGNAAANQTQTITVSDNIAPTFTAPANIEIFTTADCTYNATVAATGDVTNEADNCSTGLQATFTDSVADGQCAGSHIITRTWSLVDACGNAAPTQTQTITVSDNIAPTFTTPADITINTTADCTYDASVTATGDVTNESDNCSTGLQATFTDSVADGQCAGSHIITRTWSLVDACGNAAANQTQTITVRDNIAPTFTAPANIEVFTTADCTYDASIAVTGDVTNEADNCSTGLQATFTDSVADGQCAGSHIITRTWSLVDACGNAAANQTQTITVRDNIAPTFTAPANIEVFTTADCTYDASIAVTGDVTNEADNCSTGLQATFTDSVVEGACAGSKVIVRTWSLVDACGNAAANQTQTITISDNIVPTFTAPADTEIFTTADCTYNATVAATGDVTNEADNCSTGLQATFTDSVAEGQCAGSHIITRTWSLVDACGNAAANQTQTITVRDNIAPTFTAPADITINTTADCTYDASVTATGDVTNEADNCSTGLQATFTDSVADGTCPGSKIITRTWSLVDACGNAAANQTQTITVRDNIAPTFTTPAGNLIVQCGNGNTDALQTWLTANGGAVASDNCSDVTWSNNFNSISNDCSAAVTVIFTATDACGNAATSTATFTIEDTTAPTFTAPANIEIFTTADCTYDASVAATGDVTDEADNCTALQATFTDSVADGQCAGSHIITRTWSLVDACGNAAANQTQTITVRDNIAPTFTAPADITINTTADCTYDASVAATGDVTNEADNCSTGLQATFTDSVADGQCAGSHIITRTWSLVDACGNAAANQTQTITVRDNIAPTFTAPADITINTTADCTYDASVTATGDVTNEADNCSTGLQATFTDSIADGTCAGSKIITRTWSLVDACGNAAANQTQTITVRDNIAPTFTTPADITINTTADCTYDATVTATGDVTNEADNCSTGLQATFTDSVADGQCAGSHIITRTWSLVDACGNAAANQTQTITVRDNIAPTFTAPADITINTTADCTYDASVTATGDVTNEADNCSTGLQATFTDSVADGTCAGSHVITRTWSLVDACGNAAANQTQTITVRDNIAPTFTAPADITINTTADCTYDASVSATGDVTNEADNCSTGLQATFTDSVADGQCAGSHVITRTWSLVDACGNAAANQIQTITVRDNIAPTFTAPADITINTTADCTYDASVTATGDVTNEADNCSTGLQATFTDSVADGACAGSHVITRTWSLVDACGNAAANQTQTITVRDNIAPTFTAPADITINTTADCTYDASVSATGDVTNEADNCSTGLQATFTDSVADGACAGSHIITRTWSLVDACGNAAANQIQTITVRDNMAPVAPQAPAPISVTCSGDVPAMISLTAMDNCNGAITVNGVDSTVPGACPNSFTVTRTWTFTDACSNTSSVSQIITVNDTVPPTLTQAAPANTTASCDTIPPAAVLTATDNCGTATVNMTETIIAGSCAANYQIVRTWTATDACGNSSAPVSQTITVSDTVGPKPVVPIEAKLTVNCSEVPPAPALTAADFTDNCSSVGTPVFTQTQSEPVDGAYIIIRTWSVADACGVTSTFTQTIHVTQTTDIIQLPSVQTSNDINENISLNGLLPAGVTGGTWTNVNNVGGFDPVNGTFNPFGIAPANYLFSYIINSGQCPVRYDVIIIVGQVNACLSVEIHNAFTPNGDGINDYFSIEHIEDTDCYPTNKVEIYNRWGILVYETKQYDNNSRRFEGISEGRVTVSKSEELPTGTYFYIIEWTTPEGQKVNKDGYLYLTR